MNKELRIKLLKQACKDIENNAENIIGGTQYDKSLSVEINFYDEEFPTTTINKEFPVTFSDEITNHILEKGFD